MYLYLLTVLHSQFVCRQEEEDTSLAHRLPDCGAARGPIGLARRRRPRCCRGREPFTAPTGAGSVGFSRETPFFYLRLHLFFLEAQPSSTTSILPEPTFVPQ